MISQKENQFYSYCNLQIPEGSERRRAADGRALPLADGRGQLQLALHLPFRLPRRRGEGRRLQEGVHVLLGRDHQQGPRQTFSAGMSRMIEQFPKKVTMLPVGHKNEV